MMMRMRRHSDDAEHNEKTKQERAQRRQADRPVGKQVKFQVCIHERRQADVDWHDRNSYLWWRQQQLSSPPCSVALLLLSPSSVSPPLLFLVCSELLQPEFDLPLLAFPFPDLPVYLPVFRASQSERQRQSE